MLIELCYSSKIHIQYKVYFDDIQTAKINQGNIALKRVVESIANGDSHVPFRDSKLTMLLQVNSFLTYLIVFLLLYLTFSERRFMYYRTRLRMINQKS